MFFEFKKDRVRMRSEALKFTLNPSKKPKWIDFDYDVAGIDIGVEMKGIYKLEGDALTVGEWELAFHVADYYRSRGATLPDPPFLDVVRVRFGVSSAARHYHVPLLVSPWSYSTYRGS